MPPAISASRRPWPLLIREEGAMKEKRREVLVGLVSAAAGCALIGCEERREVEVTPGEDLMQEHGLLERVFLVYEEAATRIELKLEVDPSVIASAAKLVQRFIEGY